MPIARNLTRRALARSVTAGVAVGGLWAAGLRAMGVPNVPTLSVVGTGTSQLALLDTTSARVLVVLGMPSQDLLDQIPAMLTVLRQRIDLLIGDELALDGFGNLARDRWNVTHELVIPAERGNHRSPDTTRRTIVRTDLAIDPGNGFASVLVVRPRHEWNMATTTDGSTQRWALSVHREATEIVLGPLAEGVLLGATSRPALVVSPGDDPRLLVEKLGPAAVALNGSAVEEAGEALTSVAIVRIFRDDVARFELLRDGVRLPRWALPAYSSDSDRS